MEDKICRICQRSFEPKASNHMLCSPDCQKEAARQSQAKWKKAHPEKFKENQRTQYKNRARDARPKYAYRKTPQPRVKRRCINIITDQFSGAKRRCNRITDHDGTNYLYCSVCHALLSDGCSQEYPENLYEFESKVEDLVGFIGIGKIRK